MCVIVLLSAEWGVSQPWLWLQLPNTHHQSQPAAVLLCSHTHTHTHTNLHSAIKEGHHKQSCWQDSFLTSTHTYSNAQTDTNTLKRCHTFCMHAYTALSRWLRAHNTQYTPAALAYSQSARHMRPCARARTHTHTHTHKRVLPPIHL